MSEFDEMLAKLRAEEDQAQMSLVAIAQRVCTYRALLMKGLDPLHMGLADDLTRDYQHMLLVSLTQSEAQDAFIRSIETQIGQDPDEEGLS